MKTLYPAYAESLLDSSAPDLTGTNIKITALDSTYVYDAAHVTLDDLTGVIATSGNLASKSIAGGVFHAADVSLGSPSAGDEIVALVMYRDTGTPSTSGLMAYTDEDAGGSPISIDTDGAEVTVDFDPTTIFSVI